MRFFDPSLLVLLILAALAAVVSIPADAQEAGTDRLYHSEATELRVVLPLGWRGAEAVQERALPSEATYRWEATVGPLAGAVLVIERSVGLNPAVQQLWRRGRVSAGYHGLRPTGQVGQDAVRPGRGAGYTIEGGDRLGRVFFVQEGPVFWAVHISAPASLLEAKPDLLDTLAKGVTLSAALSPPE